MRPARAPSRVANAVAHVGVTETSRHLRAAAPPLGRSGVRLAGGRRGLSRVDQPAEPASRRDRANRTAPTTRPTTAPIAQQPTVMPMSVSPYSSMSGLAVSVTRPQPRRPPATAPTIAHVKGGQRQRTPWSRHDHREHEHAGTEQEQEGHHRPCLLQLRMRAPESLALTLDASAGHAYCSAGAPLDWPSWFLPQDRRACPICLVRIPVDGHKAGSCGRHAAGTCSGDVLALAGPRALGQAVGPQACKALAKASSTLGHRWGWPFLTLGLGCGDVNHST